jgi:CHASE3 domain sensor protein
MDLEEEVREEAVRRVSTQEKRFVRVMATVGCGIVLGILVMIIIRSL